MFLNLDIQAFYGDLKALEISLKMEKNEIISILGANGAGKSTLLRAISNIYCQTLGEIRFKNIKVSGMPPEKITRLGISHVPENRELFKSLTVIEHLELGAAYINDKGGKEFDNIFEMIPELKDHRKQLAGTLSGGEQKMLSIARALIAEPELLLLDEPSLGLAPKITLRMFNLIGEIRKKGISIILVEQNARAAMEASDRTILLRTGTVQRQGSSKELLNHADIFKVYLGG